LLIFDSKISVDVVIVVVAFFVTFLINTVVQYTLYITNTVMYRVSVIIGSVIGIGGVGGIGGIGGIGGVDGVGGVITVIRFVIGV